MNRSRVTANIESAELAAKPNQKKSVFYRFAPAAPSTCGFLFSFRRPSARYSGFLLQLVAFILYVPCCFFWAEHAFFALFQSWRLAIVVKHNILGLVRPQDPSWCPVTPSFGELSTAGRQRVFSWVASLLSSSHTWEARMWSATAGAQGTGAVCSRLSPPLLGPHGSKGHSCRTPPWACSVSRKSDATRTRVWQGTCRTRGVQVTWRADTHARKLTTH